MAGDTFTAFLNLTKPEIGGSRDSWGTKINNDMDTIDGWAKLVDQALGKLLSKTDVAAQSVASPVTFTSAATFSAVITANEGVSAPAGKDLKSGAAYFRGIAGNSTRVGSIADKFEIWNEGGTYALLSVALAGLTYRGQNVWHQYNFTPGNYANRTVNALQQFIGPIEISRTFPYFDLVYPNVLRSRLSVDANGTTIFSNGDSGENLFYIQRGGEVWTKQFGDLNTRIETRAAAFADDRLATARAEYANHAKTTVINTFTQDQAVLKDYPAWRLVYPNVREWKIQGRENGSIYFEDTTGKAFPFEFKTDGRLVTSNLGDIGFRIETRAAAFADDRLATARAEYANHAKTTVQNIFSSSQFVQGEYPTLHLNYPGKRDRAWQIREDGRLYLWDYTRGDYDLFFGTSGTIYTQELGDIGTRIDSRAATFANDRLATARAEYQRITARMAFAGDLDNNWNLNGGYTEPYAGAVLTSRNTITVTGGTAWGGGRWRYMQMRGTDNAWYTISYL